MMLVEGTFETGLVEVRDDDDDDDDDESLATTGVVLIR